MKKNVLIFPCGSEIGLEIFRSLNFSTHFNLFGGSSVDDHGKFVFKNYIDEIPNVDKPNFIQELNKVIQKYGIDFIFPAHDSVLLKLAQEKAIGNLKCEVITSPIETCEIVRSKKKTYEFFKNILPTPKVYKINDENVRSNLPVFLKPDKGQGSKGTYLAKTVEDIKFYVGQQPLLLILEYLPGKEYTVDCFTNQGGELLFCEGRRRNRIVNGISVNSSVVKDKRFTEMAKKINENLKFRGVWFFQVKERSNKELVLMEISPRVAGTMGLARSRGVNLPLLSLFDALNHTVNVVENKYNITVDRALQNNYQHDINYMHVYLDFDDLVIFNDRVNPMVIAFVYQCINNGVKVHLLTKHRENLEHTLKKFRLVDIFDEVIWINGENGKHNYVKEKNAIFIDDSFDERQKIYKEHDIPVFDSHMIESLMEKF